jgi:hypothetical protein
MTDEPIKHVGFALVTGTDSKLGREQLKKFLDRVLDPAFAGELDG